MTRRRRTGLVSSAIIVALAALAACSSGGLTVPTATTTTTATTATGNSVAGAPSTAPASTNADATGNGLVVSVDPQAPLGTISPLIRGVSGESDPTYLRDAGMTVASWGGNPSTRFNYQIGHAWNSAADWEYRNTNYGSTTGDVAHDFIASSTQAGAAVRLAVPTLGWVAKDDNNNTCSFPTADGGCGDAGKASCKQPGAVADPNRANVPSTPQMVQDWVRRMVVDQGLDIKFIAMDNEPELWGTTHYDVHPACSTYEEILDKYLTYATAVRAVAPKAQLMGPVMCCWFDYWRTAPGPTDGSHQDYLPWFLQHVRQHDEKTGVRTLDVLDVHYYPQSDVYNDNDDPDTDARRLRATRALWDRSYVDESWIDDHIAFIPRLKEIIAANYPDTPIAISEWNFGAEGTMNGALAIADALGIYGREGVYMASYWFSPKAQSPAYLAFKMFGNYDGKGSSFTGTALTTTNPNDDVASYAALDPATGHLKVMLLNKNPDSDQAVHVDLGSLAVSTGTLYRYSTANATAIVAEPISPSGHGADVSLPPYSITLLDLAV